MGREDVVDGGGSVASFAVAPNSTYGLPTSITCGFAPVRVITGRVVSTTLTVRVTVTNAECTSVCTKTVTVADTTPPVLVGCPDPGPITIQCSDPMPAPPAVEPPAVASVRAGNVIGGGDFADYRLVPDCMRALMAGKPIGIRNPLSVRPWQHVLEPLSGYLWRGAKLLLEGPDLAEAWNYGPKEQRGVPAQQLAEKLVDAFGDIVAQGNSTFLCRCGASSNNTSIPFSLLSNTRKGFRRILSRSISPKESMCDDKYLVSASI